jgi:hypothetical protein
MYAYCVYLFPAREAQEVLEGPPLNLGLHHLKKVAYRVSQEAHVENWLI